MQLYLSAFFAACDCRGPEYTGSCAAENGKCFCSEAFAGNEDCTLCAQGFYGFPDCRPCDCDSNGTM